MKLILQILSILFIVSLVVLALCRNPVAVVLMTEYTTRISVDKPDKIKDAISSAMSDLEKRDFVPVNLGVKWYPARKTYEIYAGGIDRTKLSKYEP